MNDVDIIYLFVAVINQDQQMKIKKIDTGMLLHIIKPIKIIFSFICKWSYTIYLGHKMCKLTNDDENHDKEELSPSHSTTALILNEIRAEGMGLG